MQAASSALQQRMECALQTMFFFPFFAGQKYIPSLSTRSYLHQNFPTFST